MQHCLKTGVRTLRKRDMNEQLLICIRLQVQVVVFSVPLRCGGLAQRCIEAGSQNHDAAVNTLHMPHGYCVTG